jgi:hypothetical protein
MRKLIDSFDRRFLDLKDRSAELVRNVGDGRLYAPVATDGKTIGELILRSAGTVEQMIGGITRRLWDDPFEWTLPERMHTVETILTYLEEVETSRKSGFLFFRTDDDLNKSIPAPIEMKTLFAVMTDALKRAELFYAKAESLLSQKPD